MISAPDLSRGGLSATDCMHRTQQLVGRVLAPQFSSCFFCGNLLHLRWDFIRNVDCIQPQAKDKYRFSLRFMHVFDQPIQQTLGYSVSSCHGIKQTVAIINRGT